MVEISQRSYLLVFPTLKYYGEMNQNYTFFQTKFNDMVLIDEMCHHSRPRSSPQNCSPRAMAEI